MVRGYFPDRALGFHLCEPVDWEHHIAIGDEAGPIEVRRVVPDDDVPELITRDTRYSWAPAAQGSSGCISAAVVTRATVASTRAGGATRGTGPNSMPGGIPPTWSRVRASALVARSSFAIRPVYFIRRPCPRPPQGVERVSRLRGGAGRGSRAGRCPETRRVQLQVARSPGDRGGSWVRRARGC